MEAKSLGGLARGGFGFGPSPETRRGHVLGLERGAEAAGRRGAVAQDAEESSLAFRDVVVERRVFGRGKVPRDLDVGSRVLLSVPECRFEVVLDTDECVPEASFACFFGVARGATFRARNRDVFEKAQDESREFVDGLEPPVGANGVAEGSVQSVRGRREISRLGSKPLVERLTFRRSPLRISRVLQVPP